MAKVVSMINMKGGVGKTTLTVQLAWHMMMNRNKRVLVIDLDPQSNASHYLMGAERYKRFINENMPSVFNVFERYSLFGNPINDNAEIIIPIDETVYGSTLHLLPSQLELSRTLKNPTGKEHLLAQYIRRVEENYDFIIIDCPPTESIFTTSAYMASQYILIPVKPEFLSTIGIPLLAKSLKDYKESYNREDLEVLGIVLNDVPTSNDPETEQSRKEIQSFAKKNDWHLFNEEVHHSKSYLRSVREQTAISDTRYAQRSTIQGFDDFANSFARSLGL